MYSLSDPIRVKWKRTVRSLSTHNPPDAYKKDNIKSIFTDDLNHVFFGYYDVSPFSHDDSFLLAMHVPAKNISASSDPSISVGYYDLREKNPPFFQIGETTTWCWQQGCRLQWFPEKNHQAVLYNRLVEGQYGCVIQHLHSKKIKKSFKRPIYSVSKDGNWGLSLNFFRLQRLRPGYGYVNSADNTLGELAPENDGIWLIDMNNGNEKLLFSVHDITELEPFASMDGAEHYFNHILFNPDGSRFMFFHVWLKSGRRYTRLITCNINGEDRYALVNEGHVSHYNWKSEGELLAFSTHKETGMNYHLYRDKSKDRQVIGKGQLIGDGHPSYSPDKSLILTDTYHDEYRDQHLMVYKVSSQKLYTIGSFYSPLEFAGEKRCDLHPRWSSSGRYICIDTPYKGRRSMHLIDARKVIGTI